MSANCKLLVHVCQQIYTNYTVSQKVLTFKLSVTFSNQILTDFQNVCTTAKNMKFATKPTRHNPSQLRHVATLPWKIKKSNFSRYSADMDENANKLYFKFTAFNSSVCVIMYAELCVSRIFKILSIQGHRCFLWVALKRDGCCVAAPHSPEQHPLFLLVGFVDGTWQTAAAC